MIYRIRCIFQACSTRSGSQMRLALSGCVPVASVFDNGNLKRRQYIQPAVKEAGYAEAALPVYVEDVKFRAKPYHYDLGKIESFMPLPTRNLSVVLAGI